MMFFVVINNHWFSRVDETGAYLIDRCGAYVTPIINYLRHGQLVVDDSVNPAGVLEEARFFGITSIIPQLEQLVQVFIHIARKFVEYPFFVEVYPCNPQAKLDILVQHCMKSLSVVYVFFLK